jgi:DNA-binding transcriptional MocR family regulator
LVIEGHLPLRRIGTRELAGQLQGWREAQPCLPGYAALADRLRTLVLDGRLPLRAALPSERALAQLLGTSRTLTTAAYRQLREQGFADSRHGAGTWTALPGHAGAPQAWLAGDQEPGIADLAHAAPEGPPELHGALMAALADLPRLLPGHGLLAAGQPELRAAIAARYTARGLPTSAEEVLVTAGASQGLRLVLADVLDAGDRLLVEDPTWPHALDTARALGARPVGLPVEDGWDARAVRSLLRRGGVAVAYLMPDAQNPTGRVLDGAARAELAAALADAGCLTIVDETLAELDLRAELGGSGAITPAPFGAGGRPGAVVHVGSASKLFWGGLRVGWVRAERSVIRRLVVARAADDLGGPPVEQLATAHLFDRIDTLLPRRRAELAARCRALLAALARDLPGWTAPLPDAGLSLWCRLPAPAGSAVSLAARGAGVALPAGARFGVEGGFEGRIRLTFSSPPAVLDDAVRRLAAALSGHGGAARLVAGQEPEPVEPPLV